LNRLQGLLGHADLFGPEAGRSWLEARRAARKQKM
jgi:hypothetical protein